jgi:hypothetical protein
VCSGIHRGRTRSYRGLPLLRVSSSRVHARIVHRIRDIPHAGQLEVMVASGTTAVTRTGIKQCGDPIAVVRQSRRTGSCIRSDAKVLTSLDGARR